MTQAPEEAPRGPQPGEEAPESAPKMTWRQWLGHDVPASVQFIKYAIAGGLATLTDVIVYLLLAVNVFPALNKDQGLDAAFMKLLDIPPPALDPELLTFNFVACKTLSFFVANLVAYVLNILFVFRRGRHGWKKELAMFYLVSGIAFGIAVTLSALMINYVIPSGILALGIQILVALMINYAGRKYIIFKG